MIEEQVQFFRLKNETEKRFPGKGKRKPIITISREFGARGAALALNLQEKLGFKIWDKELLTVIGEKMNSKEDLLESLDENVPNPVEDAIFGFLNRPGTNLNYMLYLVRAIRTIERLGGGIVVGRGANYICQRSDSLHLRIVSPFKTRIENYSEREEISISEATKIIKQKDKERSDFTRRNFNRDINTPTDYDLMINSGEFTMDEMVDLVMNAYECKLKTPIER